MVRGTASVQMLAGNQRITGVAQFLHLSCVFISEPGQSNNCKHQNWHCDTLMLLLQANSTQNIGQEVEGGV